ncbi:hypothetical protein JHK87_014110 [Glycine soja]|nr:hypothetical protein JHK87_014110 [Glycine soja]
MDEKTTTFVRDDSLSVDMPIDSDVFRVPPGYNAPQQGDHVGKGVIISWITPHEPGSSTVKYWAENSEFELKAHGFYLAYKYFNYTSGYIHHCTIHNLEFDTKYYYEVGIGNTTRQFWFKTPPPVGPNVPYTFGLIGDLGQTYNSNTTLTHYEKNPVKGQTILYVGDLSYADDFPYHDNTKWDTWGRFTERIAAYQPWIWTAGNHEIDFAPELKRVSNIAYSIVNGLHNPINDQSAPVYITIGDGGNIEGLATAMTEPQPSYSAYREASFGHGILDIKNRTHAYFSWNRNQDGYAVVADSIWLYNRYWTHPEQTSLALFR